MSTLTDKTIAILATDGFEDSELTSPREAAESAGAAAVVISTKPGSIEGKKGTTVDVDLTSAEASAADYDALILPGGTSNADHIRTDENAVKFVKELVGAGKPVAVICHGGWILTDADVLKGVTITSYPSLKTDLANAGATWVDEEVVVDKRIVSSRTPDDLEAFNAKLVEEFSK
ncbi:type 1 glutamine amidotransferase domain-containing protein [Corynebacterium aquatimens]|uniref:Protease I n=1 Tax=Corynebacterium aquatimens TaxID=1190508 RepID=A0A931E3F4_9CORY|nr:type 1 glutamine amidotransferase domain-containing protein [Corynebacterium aquatimens]MBG6122905.1 protease I [Corynebacterium aquatimens]WJY66760.1 Putative cysteine protease YraA [Corynebacterium aquatimens]